MHHRSSRCESHSSQICETHPQLVCCACRVGRPLTLSLEMFERDVQGVMDEYLAGSITERDLRQVSTLYDSHNRINPGLECT